MDLSLQEAAEFMDRSVRQIRYLIQKGTLPAHKVDGKWRIPKDTVMLTAKGQKARQHKQEKAARVAEDVLAPKEKKGAHYSVKDLRAFGIAKSLYHKALETLDEHHPAPALLLEALMQLGCGCHAYRPTEKVNCFSLAREKTCRACMHLLVGLPAQEELADQLEQELIPMISGLIRRVEAKRR